MQLESGKYASSNDVTGFFAANLKDQSESFVSDFQTYFESGAGGAWSLDPRIVRYQVEIGENNDTLWFGRDHPLQFLRSTPITPFSALGSIWTQNDIHALEPVVDGWIGFGYVKNVAPGIKLSLAYSPLFIPTFGPSLGISNQGTLNPARFAQLPPQQVNINGAPFAIDYQIQTGQISSIVLQQSALMAAGYDTHGLHVDVYAYTAPNPNPSTSYTEAIALKNQTANAVVTVTPTFDRQYWSGFQAQLKDVLFQPTVEFTQGLQDFSLHSFSLSGSVQTLAKARATFGLLTHLSSPSTTPSLSDWLVYAQIPFALTARLEFKTIFETTLLTGQQSFYWANTVEYHLNPQLALLAEAKILSGQDNSYFGEWRNDDSISAGVKWVW